MEHDGDGGMHELFGDHNLENDLRHFISPAGSPHLSFSLPDHGQESTVPSLDPTLHAKTEPGDPPQRQPEGRGEPWISERELREHFGIPLNEVATKFGICSSALKRLCRKYGVMRWPHRRLQTLEKRMQVIEDELRTTVGAAGRGMLQSELATLQREREAIYEGNLHVQADDDAEVMQELPSKRPAEPTTSEHAAKHHPSVPARHPQSEMRKGAAQKLLGKTAIERGGRLGSLVSERGPMPGEDVSAMIPPDLGANEVSLGRGESVEMERLVEENASLRAISNYLMQERKELANKAELSAKRNENLECLLRVLRLKVGVLNEYRTTALIDPTALALLEQLVGAEEMEVEEGAKGARIAHLHFNNDGMLADDGGGGGGRGGDGGQQGGGRGYQQDMGWLSGHGGEHSEDILSELI